MDNYDSDTSSEGGDGVQTAVTLGYASTESTGDDISRIGGHPEFINDAVKPAANLVTCKACNSYLSLLLELQADLQEQFPGDERRLYIWCCRKKQCSRKPGSIRAFRETKKAKTNRKVESKPEAQKEQPAASVQDLGSQLFGTAPVTQSNSQMNPFSTSSSSSQPQSNPFQTSLSSLAAKPPQTPSEPPIQTFAEKLKISTSSTQSPSTSTSQEPAPWPAESEFPSPFPRYHLAPEPEYLERLTTLPNTSLQPTVTNGSSSEPPERDAKDTFESSMDKTFQTFSDIIGQNSEQVLRYEFRGTPLLYNSIDDVATRFHVPHGKSGPARGMPRCEGCGAARVFEVQLVPGLIYELEKDDDAAMDLESGEGMVWGTIVVGVCERNCGVGGEVAFREEWVGSQWEEGLVRK